MTFPNPLTPIDSSGGMASKISGSFSYISWAIGDADGTSTKSKVVIPTLNSGDARAGDLVVCYAGNNYADWQVISSVNTNNTQLTVEFPFAKSPIGDSFIIYRRTFLESSIGNANGNGMFSLFVATQTGFPLEITNNLSSVIQTNIGPVPTVFLPSATLAFGSVTTAYAALLSFAVSTVRQLKISNKLDRDVYLSFDGGTTDHWFLASLETNIIDLAANGFALQNANDVWVKSIGSNAGAGNIYANGIYTT